MLLKQAFRPMVRAIRQHGHGSHDAPVKFTGQHPKSFVHDGWASARLPFNVDNKWSFAVKGITILAIGFWAPFIVVEYQLRKANSQ